MVHAQQKIELKAEPRLVLGGKARALRRSGLLPAILYGKNQDSLPLQVSLKDFNKVLKTAGESTLIYVNVSEQSYPTILHADFYKVRLDEKIKTKVPVVFIGESPAVKESGGIFIRNVNELEVEALPQDLPHEITVDIFSLKNFGDQILVKDVDLGTNVKIETDSETIVATVQEPMSEEELKASLETPTVGVEDVEVIKKEKEEVAEETAETKEESAKKGRV